jgi:hypothetical protein
MIWVLGILAILFLLAELVLMRASANREQAWQSLSEEEVPL